jgi:hypothetical protein
MVKIVNPRGWDWDRPVAQMVKVSRDGLRGNDRKEFLKFASHEFVDMFDSSKTAEDEMPVHLIALGASEAYGPNRNGDGFKEATCKKYHHTFKKFARWYRNHKNKDPDKSYGYIKASAYNDAMRRVELLVMLNMNKKAAERNGGLVADRELEKLADDRDLAVSMACRVPYDVCSGCGNKARTRDEYCKSAGCKYGGCSSNLTKVAADGHILHVDNPTPTWFDISDVYRPADRIAYGGKADWLQKAAAAEDFTGGAELADALGISAPLDVVFSQDNPYAWSAAMAGQIKLAYGLAELERKGHRQSRDVGRAFLGCVQPEINEHSFQILGYPGSMKCAEGLGALADRKVVMPLRDFANWLGKAAAVDAARNLIPGIFGRMIERGDFESRIAKNPFITAEKTASVAQRTLAANLTAGFSLARDAVIQRTMLSSLRRQASPNLISTYYNEKQAADCPEAARLAEDYGLYKLAALHRIAAMDQEFNLTSRFAIAQNCV